MSVELVGTDWSLFGASKNPSSRKFKMPNRIDYLIKESRCKHNGREDLAELALDAAKHVNQLEGNRESL